MNNIFIKKIIPLILTVAIVFSTFGFALPNKVSAQMAVAEVNSTPSLFQQIANAISGAATAASSYSTEFKEYVLDGLASALAKQIIHQMTASVVNWINSGFEGSPSFITNPGAFFLDVADQITGDFLARAGGPLTALCSPFSIDIRIALAFKYHPSIQKRYACTLSTIIKNSKNAVEGATINGASINGFMNGDFNQGGWPAFISLTTEPQNNMYGAYLTAESELSIRVANAQAQQRDEIGQGRGFLSWRKCADVPIAGVSEEFMGPVAPGGEANAVGSDFMGPVNEGAGQIRTEKVCEVQTPGSVIQGALEANVNGPLHELQLADELNEIVNALFAQLITQILSKGLGAVSGSGPSDSSSYIYEIQNEGNGSIDQLNSIRIDLIKNLSTYLDYTLQYKENKDMSLNTVLDVKNAYESAKACYVSKMTTNPSMIQSKIDEINSIISTNISPQATKLLGEAQDADKKYQTLLKIRNQANAARTVNEIREPSQEYSRMIQSRDLVSAKDIVDSQQELNAVKESMTPLKQDALRKSQDCQLLPSGGGF